jgi:DNA-binding transcriptional ArsR family regulator
MSSETPPGFRRLTDARAMRALAHPVRVALLEALAHAGTLTATQASEMLGESPANCAFHLRILAKYGYVEEAGGGRGRERPWRRAHSGLHLATGQADPQAAVAAQEVAQFTLDHTLARAHAELARETTWPAEWRDSDLLGLRITLAYLTPEEAQEMGAELDRIRHRYRDRVDHPERRPPGAMPVELVGLGYPLPHLAAQPPASGPQSD